MITIKLDENNKKHYYLQIEEKIKAGILRGELTPNTKLPSIKEWAPIIGVNLHTVNRALNNLTKEGLLYRRRKIGTFVSGRPAKEKVGKEKPRRSKILVLLPTEANLNYSPYTQEVIRGISSKGARYNLEIEIICFDKVEKCLRKEVLKKKNIAGILIDKEGFLDKNVIRIIGQYEGRTVLFNSTLLTHREVPSVVMDNAGGAFLATEHLISNGHRKIAIVLKSALISSDDQGGYLDYVSDNMKLLGYTNALQKHEMAVRLEFRKQGVYRDTKKIKEAVEGLIGLRPAPTAVFCADDLIASEVLKVLKEKGIRVPDDISLVGFNNLFHAQASQPRLTTVGVPLFEMGQKAVDLLFANNKNRHLVLDAELVERDSVGPASTEPEFLAEKVLNVARL